RPNHGLSGPATGANGGNGTWIGGFGGRIHRWALAEISGGSCRDHPGRSPLRAWAVSTLAGRLATRAAGEDPRRRRERPARVTGPRRRRAGDRDRGSSSAHEVPQRQLVQAHEAVVPLRGGVDIEVLPRGRVGHEL